MQLRNALTLLIFLVPAGLFAQEKDITGLWKGSLFNDTTQKFYRYEIGISKDKGKYTGFSHTWFLIGDTQYFGVKKVAIRIANDGKILIEDNGLIANNYPIPPNKGVRQLNVLTLNAADSIMTLTGPFSTNRTKDYHSLTGSIQLQRKNDFWQSSLVPHLQELGRDEELSFVKADKEALARKNEAEKQAELAERRAIAMNEKKADEKKKLDLATEKKQQREDELIAKASSKVAADRKSEEEKALVKSERLREETARAEAAEKEKTNKLLAKQEMARKNAETKLEAKQAADQKKSEASAAAEKEKMDKALARQEEGRNNTVLSKKNTTPPDKKDEKPTSPPVYYSEPAADVNLRKTVVQQTVNFSSDSLELTLYDNGEIDGDTVSVLMNGKLLLAKQGLGIKAIRHTIYIPHDVDKVEMVMYAETLGSIPPNTGLLVIKDGKELYEIRFSGDLQKNAAIVFNRKKE
ncbi:MAG: hypothetical protein EOO06_05225 [Chitinophagaceae bacterium]|nr:MAG: hypothetical protein EOO06_05225 [Chitinophagaceae bacterium]